MLLVVGSSTQLGLAYLDINATLLFADTVGPWRYKNSKFVYLPRTYRIGEYGGVARCRTLFRHSPIRSFIICPWDE